MQTNDSNNTSNQVKPDEFRVGDTVWCLMRGKGTVVMVLTAKDFQHCPILVDFPETVNPVTGEKYSNRHSYSKDGKWSQEFNRTLFFSEPKIEASVTRPFVPTLVGKKVVVRQKDCHDVMTTITYEDYGTFGDKLYTFYKCLVEVYEVQSENLLKR